MPRGLRLILKVVAAFVATVVLYVGVTFVQVWRAARSDGTAPAQAIVVFGAAQYDGRPSPVLRARLDHAADLWRRDVAPLVVVTGGKRPGDRTTEAATSAAYLAERGVPDGAILREVQGTSSWDSLAAAAGFLHRRGIDEVLLVSDPFHSLRIRGMAGELNLDARTSPTRTSPIRGLSELRRFAQEAVAVSIGRVIGYRRLVRVDRVVTRAGSAAARASGNVLVHPSGVV